MVPCKTAGVNNGRVNLRCRALRGLLSRENPSLVQPRSFRGYGSASDSSSGAQRKRQAAAPTKSSLQYTGAGVRLLCAGACDFARDRCGSVGDRHKHVHVHTPKFLFFSQHYVSWKEWIDCFSPPPPPLAHPIPVHKHTTINTQSHGDLQSLTAVSHDHLHPFLWFTDLGWKPGSSCSEVRREVRLEAQSLTTCWASSDQPTSALQSRRESLLEHALGRQPRPASRNEIVRGRETLLQLQQQLLQQRAVWPLYSGKDSN